MSSYYDTRNIDLTGVYIDGYAEEENPVLKESILRTYIEAKDRNADHIRRNAPIVTSIGDDEPMLDDGTYEDTDDEEDPMFYASSKMDTRTTSSSWQPTVASNHPSYLFMFAVLAMLIIGIAILAAWGMTTGSTRSKIAILLTVYFSITSLVTIAGAVYSYKLYRKKRYQSPNRS